MTFPYQSQFGDQTPRVAPNPFLMAADILNPIPNKYFDDPVLWVHDMILWDGDSPTFYQNQIMAVLPEKKRLSVRGPHGLGKTTIAAWIILWFAITRDEEGLDWKIPTTASAWRQLDKFLWPEIHKWARRLNWEKLGRRPFSSRDELLRLNLKLNTGQAFAVASDEPELIEGAHADHLLYLFDESKAIPAGTWDAAEGAFSGAGAGSVTQAYALSISTPGEPNGRFWEIQMRRPGFEDWYVMHVKLDDAIKAGRINEGWANQRKLQWGEHSAVYQNRVAGEFATSDADGVIPLAWVEAAQDRWRDRYDIDRRKPDGPTETLPAFTCVACDPARSGENKSTIGLRYGRVLKEIREIVHQEDTSATTGAVVGIVQSQGGYAVIDVVGVGGPIVDRCREQNIPVYAFNAAEKTDQADLTGELGFVNMRSAAWWTLREILDPGNGWKIELPPSDILTGDLTAPHWKITSGGKIQLESKDDLKKRLGRSTDYADVVVQAFALLPEGEEILVYDERVSISPY